MKYWRYKVLECSMGPNGVFMLQLEDLGSNGWELVALDKRLHATYYIFKLGYDLGLGGTKRGKQST